MDFYKKTAYHFVIPCPDMGSKKKKENEKIFFCFCFFLDSPDTSVEGNDDLVLCSDSGVCTKKHQNLITKIRQQEEATSVFIQIEYGPVSQQHIKQNPLGEGFFISQTGDEDNSGDL